MKKISIKYNLLFLSVMLFLSSCRVSVDEPKNPYYESTELPIIVRDFVPYENRLRNLEQYRHPDFENINNDDNDIVEEYLNANKKPVFNSENANRIRSITSAESFAQWFITSDDVNREIKTSISFIYDDNDIMHYKYENSYLHPIDNQGFGNDIGYQHNYNFTVESTFYLLCKKDTPITITCESDDDLWLFVNGKLAIDLGGRHSSISKTITFNAEDYNSKAGDYLEVKLFKADRGADVAYMAVKLSQEFYLKK